MIEGKIIDKVNQYKNFMGIDEFPEYEIIYKDNSLDEVLVKGYSSLAQAKYDYKNMKHTLIIPESICPEYILFHEFTHILDSEKYVNGDGNRYMGLYGYTEYHASQIELLSLLKVKTISSNISFSMTDVLKTYSGEKTVKEYIETKRESAKELFSQEVFLKDFDSLKDSLGVLFNYWGLRSICKMYAKDYHEVIDNEAFLRYISSYYFCILNNLMTGWLNEEKIEKSIEKFNNLIIIMHR